MTNSENFYEIQAEIPGDLVIGVPGKPGDPGYTPRRGIDYWTEADRQGIIADVLSSKPITAFDRELEQMNEAMNQYAEQTGEQMSSMEHKIIKIIEDMNYKPIEITSISDDVDTVERGVAVPSLTVEWTLNKEPVSQTIGGETIPNDARSWTVDMTGKTSVTLVVTDERGATDSASAGYNAYNGVYYGVLEDGVTIDSAAILSLGKKVQGSRGVTFTADCTGGKRIAYAIPASGYGSPVFQDYNTKYPVDMIQVPDQIQFTNDHEYTTAYNVWLSTNMLEGSITVVIS